MAKCNILIEPHISISPFIFSSIPYPAFSKWINFHLGKEIVDVFYGQEKWFGEILTSSHDSSSYDELRLGSGRCLEHLLDPIILAFKDKTSQGI
jgi:hypothetical protein